MVAIIAAVAVVFAAFGNLGHNNSTNQSINPVKQESSSDNNGTSNTSNQIKISPEEAQKIAQKYIEEPGATAGTPTLSKSNGQYVYTVPVINNRVNVGEIEIDAQTGENLGGAGGSP